MWWQSSIKRVAKCTYYRIPLCPLHRCIKVLLYSGCFIVRYKCQSVQETEVIRGEIGLNCHTIVVQELMFETLHTPTAFACHPDPSTPRMGSTSWWALVIFLSCSSLFLYFSHLSAQTCFSSVKDLDVSRCILKKKVCQGEIEFIFIYDCEFMFKRKIR